MGQPEIQPDLNQIVKDNFDNVFTAIRARLTFGLGIRSTGIPLTSDESQFGSVVGNGLRRNGRSSFFTSDETIIESDATPITRSLYFAKLGHQVIRSYDRPLPILSDISSNDIVRHVGGLLYRNADFQRDNLALRDLTERFMPDVDDRTEQRDFSHMVVMTSLASLEDEYRIDRLPEQVEHYLQQPKK